MKKFNNVFEQINAILPQQWKIQALRRELECHPGKAEEIQRQIDAARLQLICARRGYLLTI